MFFRLCKELFRAFRYGLFSVRAVFSAFGRLNLETADFVVQGMGLIEDEIDHLVQFGGADDIAFGDLPDIA